MQFATRVANCLGTALNPGFRVARLKTHWYKLLLLQRASIHLRRG